LPHAEVEHLDGEQKRHGEMDVALGHVQTETLGDQEECADHPEKAQREHLMVGCRSGGSRLTRTAIMMTLSMPSTISSAVRVMTSDL
jgi:hypothetical protein